MNAPSRSPLAVRSVLEGCLDRIAGEPGGAAIWRVWTEAVGPQIARRAQPIRLRGRTLLVAVSSTPWMQELQLLKPTIVAELNARLASPLVNDLFFVLTAAADVVGEDAGTAAQTRRRDCPPPPQARELTDLPAPLRASFDGIARAWRRRARE